MKLLDNPPVHILSQQATEAGAIPFPISRKNQQVRDCTITTKSILINKYHVMLNVPSMHTLQQIREGRQMINALQQQCSSSPTLHNSTKKEISIMNLLKSFEAGNKDVRHGTIQLHQQTYSYGCTNGDVLPRYTNGKRASYCVL